MHPNFIIIPMLLGLIPKNASISDTSVPIMGSVKMVDINESATLKMELKKVHPWAYLYVKIYKNDTKIIERKVLSLSFNKQTYNLDSINEYNQIDNYKVIINYYNNDKEDTIITFKNYAPTNKSLYYSCYGGDIFSTIPTKITFDAIGKNNNLKECYDRYHFNIADNFNLGNSRFYDFSQFSLSIITSYDVIDISEIEIRLYANFKNSDLTYNQKYTSLYFETIIEDNTIKIANNYDYYLNIFNGSISKNVTNYSYDETYPFFIPLECGFDKEINYEIEFTSLNSSQEKYIVQGKITLGKKLYSLYSENFLKEKYHYLLINDSLKDVEYNYA